MQQDDGGLATVADYSYDDLNSFFEIEYGNGALNRFDYDALRRTRPSTSTTPWADASPR